MNHDLTTTDDSGVISTASALAVVRAQALGIKASIAAWDLRPLPKRSRAKMDSSSRTKEENLMGNRLRDADWDWYCRLMAWLYPGPLRKQRWWQRRTR